METTTNTAENIFAVFFVVSPNYTLKSLTRKNGEIVFIYQDSFNTESKYVFDLDTKLPLGLFVIGKTEPTFYRNYRLFHGEDCDKNVVIPPLPDVEWVEQGA